MTDLEITENFIKAYFNSEKTFVFHKIYLISNKQARSQKFFKFVKDILKNLIKKRINGISIDKIYEEHNWFLKMQDVYNKIFRDTKKMHKIDKLIRKNFKEKLLFLKQEIIKKAVYDFLHKDISDFINLDLFYALNYKEEVELEIIQKYIKDLQDSDIPEIKELIESLDNNELSITDRLLSEICKNIEDFKILKCLQDKENLEFLTKLYSQNMYKYEELINIYLIEKYNINFINNISSDDHYVDNLLYMYKEYKEFDEFVKSVFYKSFINMNIQYTKFVNYINSGKKSPHLYEFVGLLYNFITDKDIFERELRKSLCLRLINSKSSIEEEEDFLETYKIYAKDIYSYKMIDVLEDFKKRIIFNNSEIMMMRKFQWVDFQNVNINLDDLDLIKNKYEEQIAKYERKKIVWMDNLSTVEVEINNKDVVLNLIQYDILININNIDNKDFISKLDLEYKKNLNYLIQKGLLIKNKDILSINADCEIRDFSIKDHLLIENKVVSDNQNKRGFGKEVLDSKIMLKLKRSKTLKISDFYELGNENDILERAKILEKKGYCKLEGNELIYCP